MMMRLIVMTAALFAQSAIADPLDDPSTLKKAWQICSQNKQNVGGAVWDPKGKYAYCASVSARWRGNEQGAQQAKDAAQQKSDRDFLSGLK